jgi:hypothetical protein
VNVTTATPAIAFASTEKIAAGPLGEVALAAKAALDRVHPQTILVFDRVTSEPIEIDFRGTAADVLARLPQPPVEPAEAAGAAPEDPVGEPAPRRPGRPKLGVIAREVTLLPRHWEWLAAQPGGASVTLRKLVENARRTGADAERRRRAQDAAYRFMLTMAGNEAGFEEACRAVYANDDVSFAALTENWPRDVRDHARELGQTAFALGEMR